MIFVASCNYEPNEFLMISAITGVPFLTMPGVAQNLPAQVPAKVLYVIDGDTFRARATIWQDLTLETNIRVARIDTPEKRRGSQCDGERRAGEQASIFAKQLLPKNSQVILSGFKKAKYAGRVIADVQLSDGRNYAQIMLKAGHAIAYNGGKKRKIWCGKGADIPD